MFTEVVDTVYDSKVFSGIANSNVVPSSFRTIQGYVNVSVPTQNVPVALYFQVLDTKSNAVIQIPPGAQVVHASVSNSGYASFAEDRMALGLADPKIPIKQINQINRFLGKF